MLPRSSCRFLHTAGAMVRAQQNPLVVIVGATGTGKSKLAVDLAKRFNGEVINGDAMQLYAGLPIITNQITEKEKQGVPHHLIGCIGWHEPTWTVGQFVPRALKVIEEIRGRGKLPILVGGTHYYTQSLLFKDRLADEKDELDQSENGGESWAILQEPTSVILAKLRDVDPVMADRWHPNDRRKIQRSLQIWLKTGKPASQMYDEQRARKDFGRALNGISETNAELKNKSIMTFPTLLLWINAEPEALHSRLDSRVGVMLEQGLLSEVASLNQVLRKQAAAGQFVDQTRGIWVSIGFKEFEKYQASLASEEGNQQNVELLEKDAIEKTKIATRQYAKRQLRWIRIKLLHALREAGAQNNLYILDGSRMEAWDGLVTEVACDLTLKFLEGEPLPEPTSVTPVFKELLSPKREYDLSQRRDLWERRYCPPCDITAVTESDWSQHIRSKNHRRNIAKKARCEKQATVLQREEEEAANTTITSGENQDLDSLRIQKI